MAATSTDFCSCGNAPYSTNDAARTWATNTMIAANKLLGSLPSARRTHLDENCVASL
jgi:hypothetical protein